MGKQPFAERQIGEILKQERVLGIFAENPTTISDLMDFRNVLHQMFLLYNGTIKAAKGSRKNFSLNLSH
jgi:hypothetical protein